MLVDVTKNVNSCECEVKCKHGWDILGLTFQVSWENQRTKWGIFHQAMFDYQRVTMLTIPKMWFISGQCAPLAQGPQGRGCTSLTKEIGLFQGGELD